MFYFIHKYSGGFDMLFLSEQEMWQSVTLEDVMDAIEDAYAIHKSGNYKMPDRFIAQRDKNMMLYMPCFLDSVIGTKMLSEFPDNPSLGIPYLNGLMILNNAIFHRPGACCGEPGLQTNSSRRSVTVCSAVLSVSCAVLGILVSILAGTPVGSTIVAMDILAFLICSVLGRVRGGIV